MIKFKRGSTTSWRTFKKPLAAGQPGYDKTKNKLKIGDGNSEWKKLPYVGGLSSTEILDSESNAKTKNRLDAEDKTLITYGTGTPDKNTVGQLYLQQYESEPEADYVVSFGVDSGWTYQKWNSGLARCWGVFELSTSVQKRFDSNVLYYSDKALDSKAYPFTFYTSAGEVPFESATLQSSGDIVWLASRGKNTKNTSGTYTIVGPESIASNKIFYVTLSVVGYWK